MATSVAPVLRDFLVRYQQMSIRETGHRPIAWIHSPLDKPLELPGCTQSGLSYWQPVPWKDGQPALGKAAEGFHQSIIDYLSMCQFMSIRFQLPVARTGSPLSFLYGRTFETQPNTESNPPSRVLEEAALYRREHPQLPLAYCMATTCDEEPICLMLRGEDGEAFIYRPLLETKPLYLKLGVDRLLPKLRFIYDI